MKTLSTFAVLAVVTAACVASTAHASIVWDEAIQGDLSNDGLAPTAFVFAVGDNTVLGATGEALQGERDYFSFTVPAGTLLTSITVRPETFVSGSSSFIGLQAGPQLTVSTSGGGVESLLGFSHYGNDSVGTDLLPALAFAYPDGLTSGAYSVWVQELGGVVPYGFDFEVTPVPLPSSAALLVGACLGLLAWASLAKHRATGSFGSIVPKIREYEEYPDRRWRARFRLRYFCGDR